MVVVRRRSWRVKTAGEALRDAPNRAMVAAMVRVGVGCRSTSTQFRNGEDDPYDGRLSSRGSAAPPLRHPGDSTSVTHTIAG